MNALEILRAVIQLLPAIIELVKAIESAFPQTGAGAVKLETALSVIQATGTVLPQDTLSKVISGVVGAFNLVGWPKP